MPKGNIYLTNGKSVEVSGGCLACYGRNEGRTSDILYLITHKVEHKGGRLNKHQASKLITHISSLTKSLNPAGDALVKGTDDYNKMAAVFHELANNSAWSDAFISKTWDEVHENGDECMFNATDYSSQYTISAISILRRTLQKWYRKMHELITEYGMNFETSYFYSVLLICRAGNDWGGDEQIMQLSLLSKPQLKTFLEGKAYPDKKDSGESYATLVGYPQLIKEQWHSLRSIDDIDKSIKGDSCWAPSGSSNPLSAAELEITPEGTILNANDYELVQAIMNGEADPSQLNSHTGSNVYSKALGVEGKELVYKWEQGMFSKHLVNNIDDIVDIPSGYSVLMSEVLA